ncbi:uncharacterized protein LOC114956374 isoform X1 [Acropora millepora]|uniref:uncharacterized protein LOC114956374 isoform X1 n=1 Tax=Acropora millepora TaxID=45264 RepID=UPI001CF503B2|nr:uncharacterized protein LOC114956374 isoform X1 [Acropora millepora]
MYLAILWCCMLGISILACFPGNGPGIREHRDGYVGVVGHRVNHTCSFLLLITQAPFFRYLKKNKYFWFLDDYIAFMYDTMDWGIGMAFEERVVNDLDGVDNQIKEGLRRKFLTKVGEWLVLVLIAAVCLIMIRFSFGKRRQEQTKKEKLYYL